MVRQVPAVASDYAAAIKEVWPLRTLAKDRVGHFEVDAFSEVTLVAHNLFETVLTVSRNAVKTANIGWLLLTA